VAQVDVLDFLTAMVAHMAVVAVAEAIIMVIIVTDLVEQKVQFVSCGPDHLVHSRQLALVRHKEVKNEFVHSS
jgi:hypothetical protein